MSEPAIRIITVSREYGSGGAAVATELARRLGWQLVDRSLIAQIARAADVDPELAERYDEHVDPFLHRLSKGLWHGGFEGVVPLAESDVVDADRMAAATRRVIEEAAAIGKCVIVGRGAPCILHERPDVLHVFVYAPRAARVRRILDRHGADADAEELMDEVDAERAAYIRHYFGQNWADRRLYDLMISSALGDETLVATILSAVSARNRRF